MKTLSYIFLCIVCIVSLACCNPYHEDIVDANKLRSVSASIYYGMEKVFVADNSNDSIDSYIAHNFHYPYDLIGDSVNLSCKMELDVDSNGYVSKFVDVTISDGEQLTKQARKRVFPVLKKEAERVIKAYKFKFPSECFDPEEYKSIDSTRISISFCIIPYPVEKIDSKELVLYYLTQKTKDSPSIHSEDGSVMVLLYKLVAMTTTDEKINFALNSDNPVIKMAAFQGLVAEQYAKCASIICNAIEKNDTTYVSFGGCCEGGAKYTVELMLDELYTNAAYSKADSLKIDSLLFYTPNVKDIYYKYKLMEKLKPTPERYQRARDLYLKEHYTHALVLLAKYKKEQDRQLLNDALAKCPKELFKYGDDFRCAEVERRTVPHRYCEDEGIEAFYALKHCPDKGERFGLTEFKR